MRDQIEYLSLSQKLTARQIAKELHVSRKIVTKVLREETISLCYRLRVEYLGQGHQGNTSPVEGWYREILIEGDKTLNETNDFIQHVLGWDNTHLYSFTVHGKVYAYLGQDNSSIVEVVEDVFENHCSTKIPLHLLEPCENDQFIYYTDFGDDHTFLLTDTGIETINDKNFLPRVTGTMGKDLIQYEPEDPEGEIDSRSEYMEPKEKQINSSLSTALQFRPNHDLNGVSPQKVLGVIKTQLEDSNKKFIGHNIKYDYLLLRRNGIHLKSIYFDTMLAAFECYGDLEFLNLGFLSEKFLG